METGYIILIVIGGILLLCLAAWLFLIGARHSKGMEKFKRVKYAHRGLHGTVGYDSFAAENSITAMKRAVEMGFGIELDVRLTADGEMVVFHDDTLDRVTNGKGRVCDYTLEELSAFRLMNTEDGIPTFCEVLSAVSGKVPLLVEIKEDGFDQSVTRKAAEILKGYNGDYIVESFNPLSLSAFRKANKRVMRGFLCDRLTKNPKFKSIKYKIIQRHLLNFLARPHFIAASREIPKMFPIPIIRALFRPAFIAWTVRSAEEESKAYKDGFTGIIFEGYMPEK